MITIKGIKKKFNDTIFNWKKRRFNSYLKMSPGKMDDHLKLMALRYLCHQIEKIIKHNFDPTDVRGEDKFDRASAIIETLKDTPFVGSPDVKWAGRILAKYQIWRNSKKKNFVINKINCGVSTPPQKNNFKDIIYRRRSVRFWKNKKVSKKIIFYIIEMGTMAPSSCNRQPWRFVVVENKQKNSTNEGPGNKSMIKKAPYIIYVAIDERLYPEKYAPAIDAGFAAQNILLAIEYYGLKACGMYQAETINQKKIKDILRMPDYFYIYVAIPFGLPAEVAEVPERTTPESITHFLTLDTTRIISYMK